MALTRASTTEPAASSQTPLDPSIRITHLSKTFKSRGRAIAALDDLDLTIERGEFVCVVGPSGCGKTTLLNILGGLETASQGSVQLAQATGGRPQCSIVFQEQGIFPWMPVLDNAAFGLAARGVARAERERIAHAMLARMGLAVRLADRVVIMTARPGRIKAILPISLSRPRHVLDMPSNSEYLRLHAQLWEYLREEVLATRNADMGGLDG